MTGKPAHFKDITLLITHYNRSSSLERLLETFHQFGVSFYEIIVSDDCSNEKHQHQLLILQGKFGFRLILSEKNRGLADNINKGQAAVKSLYTLYIQEDFVPEAKFTACLNDGYNLIKEFPDIDLVRFYAYRKFPYLKPLKWGFSEMKFSFWYPDAYQFNCYSDHPHLRHTSFPEKFGNYRVDLKSDRAEFKMAITFLQMKGKAVIHEAYRELLRQENTSKEPSQVKRLKLKQLYQLSAFFPVKVLRAVIRNVKFRIEYLFTKQRP